MQLVINTIIGASAILLAAVSFRLVYVTTRFFHFAHAVSLAIGAYTAWAFVQKFQLPLWAGVAAAPLVSGLTGALVFLVFFRPLIKREAPPLVLLLASLAVQLILQHSLSWVFGDDSRSIYIGEISVFEIAGTYYTSVHLALVLSSIAITGGLAMLNKFSMFGKRIEAIAEHVELSMIFGINVFRIELIIFFIASAIGGLLGVLVGMDLSISPDMGLNWLLPGVVAMIVGGIYRLHRVALASIGIAILRTATIWYVGGTWQDVIIYAILFMYFILKPQWMVREGEV